MYRDPTAKLTEPGEGQRDERSNKEAMMEPSDLGPSAWAQNEPKEGVTLIDLLTLELSLPSPASPVAFQRTFTATPSIPLRLLFSLAFFHHESLIIRIYHHSAIIL